MEDDDNTGPDNVGPDTAGPNSAAHNQPPDRRRARPGHTSEVLARIDALLDDAHAMDWDQHLGNELTAEVLAASRLGDRLSALRVKITAALDRTAEWAERGHRNCAALLRTVEPTRNLTEISRTVLLGNRLRRMPATAAAFETGGITTEHVRLLSRCLHPRYGDTFDRDEDMLVGHAQRLHWDDWVKVMNRWFDAADRTEPDAADDRDIAAREVHLSRTLNNRGVLAGTLTPHAHQEVRAELDRLTQQLFTQDWAEATERLGDGNVTADSLTRTPSQRRHDALLEMARRSAAADNPTAPHSTIYVHCTVEEFEASLRQAAGLDVEPVDVERGMREYEDGTPISRRMLARLAILGTIKRVVWDTASKIVDIGTAGRLFTANQREVIAIRDRSCNCGCGLAARHCEADHIIEVRDGGKTITANGQPLCHASHRRKTIRRTLDGPPDHRPSGRPATDRDAA